jgi:pantothenate kinase
VINLTAQEMSLDELISRVRALAVPGERHILGLTGAPGAGKSTIAAHVVDTLGPTLAVLVPMDGFHLSNEVLIGLGRSHRKGAHDTFDPSGYASLMTRIRGQREAAAHGHDLVIYAPRFRREIEEPIGSSIPIYPQTPLVVTEGNYLLLESDAWPVARAAIDHVWFLAPLENVRHERLVLRHETYGKSHDEAKMWALGSDQNNAEMIEATAGRAELILRLT